MQIGTKEVERREGEERREVRERRSEKGRKEERVGETEAAVWVNVMEHNKRALIRSGQVPICPPPPHTYTPTTPQLFCQRANHSLHLHHSPPIGNRISLFKMHTKVWLSNKKGNNSI